MKIAILGLSITSSWGNGHATTYRGLVRALIARGHQVIFLERHLDWYAENRDLNGGSYGRIEIYRSVRDLRTRFATEIRDADLVVVGSYVPEGVAVGNWATSIAQGVTSFYDIDTPITLAKLRDGDEKYLSRELVKRYAMYLSFSGGPALDCIEKEFGSRMARALHCSVDPEMYFPKPCEGRFDLGYMGTYSDDRQPVLDRLMLQAARRNPDTKMIVAGPQYPDAIEWPPNVTRITHLSPQEHCAFYNSQRFTLNVTRREMVRMGYSPSVRLFEAAACGTPIISDNWNGLDTFFKPQDEILLARSANDTLKYLASISESERAAIGKNARRRVLREHTAAHRAIELEQYTREASALLR